MNNNYLIDSHSHLHDPEFFPPDLAEKMLVRATEAGVRQIICIGTSDPDSRNARAFAELHENVFWTYGIHPEEAVSESTRGFCKRPSEGLPEVTTEDEVASARNDGPEEHRPEEGTFENPKPETFEQKPHSFVA